MKEKVVVGMSGGVDAIFYRFSWSKAHEEPRLTPLATTQREAQR